MFLDIVKNGLSITTIQLNGFKSSKIFWKSFALYLSNILDLVKISLIEEFWRFSDNYKALSKGLVSSDETEIELLILLKKKLYLVIFDRLLKNSFLFFSFFILFIKL